jgi:hypothetical protein
LAPSSYPYWITAGSDGALWLTENYSNQVGRITTGGTVTEYAVASEGQPFGITAGPDGALWFAEWSGNRIARMTTSGVLTEYPLAAFSMPNEIATGPDGEVWFTEWGAGEIGHAPACGLGFSASLSGTTLTLNFDLGIDFPATFDIFLYTAAGTSRPLSEAMPAIVPPRPFTMKWDPFPNLGNVTVQPELATALGQPHLFRMDHCERSPISFRRAYLSSKLSASFTTRSALTPVMQR